MKYSKIFLAFVFLLFSPSCYLSQMDITQHKHIRDITLYVPIMPIVRLFMKPYPIVRVNENRLLDAPDGRNISFYHCVLAKQQYDEYWGNVTIAHQCRMRYVFNKIKGKDYDCFRRRYTCINEYGIP